MCRERGTHSPAHKQCFTDFFPANHLCQVNGEVNRYNGVLKRFADAADDEWEAIVATYRGDLQKAFFEHVQVRPGSV